MSEVKIDGVGGQLTLTKKRVIIERKGKLAFITHGMSGTKEIPIKNITAVQFKSASLGINGFIQFSILGSNESKGGILDATSDENTVTFSKSSEPNFREIKRYIDSIIDEEPIDIESLNITNRAMTGAVAKEVAEINISDKSKVVAIMLSLFFGGLGFDRFYLGSIWLGIGKILTFGGFGVWALVDLIYIILGEAHDSKGLKVIK